MNAFALVTLRRLARPWFVLLAAVLAFLAARSASTAPDALDAAGRALARTQVWCLLFFLAPFLAHAAAALARPEAARAWLAGGARATTLALGGTLGSAASGAALCLALFGASELALAGGATCQRLLARPEHPVGFLHAGDPSLEWRVPRPAGATHAGLALALGSGTSAVVRWSMRDGEGVRHTEIALGARRWLALELPPESTGELVARLELAGPGAVLVLGRNSLDLLAPAGSERAAAALFALHAALALALVLGLSLVLARVLPPFLASVLALVLSCLAASRALGPAGELVRAFDELGLGRAPAWPSALAWLSAAGAGALFVLTARPRGARP